MKETEVLWALPDIPRFYTALAEWLTCFLFIMGVKRKVSGWRLTGISAAALAVQGVFLELTGKFDGIWWLVCMAAAVGLMYVYLFLCCDMNGKNVGYCCVQAFVLAEFFASLEWQLDCFFRFELEIRIRLFFAGLLVFVYGGLAAGVLLLNKRLKSEEDSVEITNRELASCVLIGAAVFGMSNLSFLSSGTPFSGMYMPEVFNIRTLIDLGGAAVLYAYHIQRVDLRMRYELETMETILHNQYQQYQQSQELMELINYKYHDLKHYIIALQNEGTDAGKKEFLHRMKEEIQSYEAQNKTGNHVLDTLFTSKSLTCMKHHITMTSVVDGSLFHFMDTMDICSIFGNALDNAIECEKKIEDEEKRLIHVTACSQNSFLIICFENYCEEELQFENQLPVTTKKENQFHGYGLKSLRHTVHKYGGEVDIHVQDNWFDLKILIPR